MANKYHQIGYVCKVTDLTHATIRFWEKNFPKIRPMRSSGGHRFYNANQIDIIMRIKKLLYVDGFTIDGAKKKLAEESKINDSNNINEAISTISILDETTQIKVDKIRSELNEILKLLS